MTVCVQGVVCENVIIIMMHIRISDGYYYNPYIIDRDLRIRRATTKFIIIKKKKKCLGLPFPSFHSFFSSLLSRSIIGGRTGRCCNKDNSEFIKRSDNFGTVGPTVL